MRNTIKFLNKNIIFFTPLTISKQIINERLSLIKHFSDLNNNININITDMARNPDNTLKMIDIYIKEGINPDNIITHVAAHSREKYNTDILLNKLKIYGIKNILCVNGDTTNLNKISNTYDVYELIKKTKEDFNICLSAYPENLIYNNINNRFNYTLEDQILVLNKKIELLKNSKNEIKFFLQHSYNINAIKYMNNLLEILCKKYNIIFSIYPSILPLFNPKYVTNVSGNNPVNNNMVDIPEKYLNLINRINKENYNFNNNLINVELFNETEYLIDKIRKINNNIAIYNTNNYKLMKLLIERL